MTTEKILISRSGDKCELCAAQNELTTYEVPPDSDGSADQCLLLCSTCNTQIETRKKWMQTIGVV